MLPDAGQLSQATKAAGFRSQGVGFTIRVWWDVWHADMGLAGGLE